ncbi:inorganic triphosphatase YgiF [Propionicimonas paludicola]|uniref:Inorganic triphosphatase YgiF n=1 Tax=Propionicimonas paludicola TaxID=185243 RepID=A0A2A9CRK8_9ACTN|nr:CYTH and CHAD domain-containing protein [Propionicimonas paludicola]PFG16756.1 inorganic triphosphatase YgiF [Propionicimonas paludicola]
MVELEIERKYALGLDQSLPSLAGTLIEGPINNYQLVATYYDTPDQRLRAERLVIRRRTGGRDDGWHLKAPGQDADHRVEQQLPIDPDAPGLVPPGFWEEVSQRLGGQPLVPVATLHTFRQEQDLLGADHAVLARLCIDEVYSDAAGHRDHWREAELELAAGQLALLDELEAILAAAGIVRATDVAKIARALGAAPTASAPATAGQVVQAYLAGQLGVLQHWYRDPSGLPGGDAHDGRVACRRLRSVLGTFGSVFAAGARGRLRAELRWLGLQLSPARDAEVVADRLAAGIADCDPAAAPLVEGYRESVLRARLATLEESLDRSRVAAILVGIEGLLSSEALSPRAEREPSAVLAKSWRSAVAAVRTEQAAALQSSDEQAWHGVRKAAKAARYGAEVLVSALPGYDQQRVAWEQVTEALGVVQDAVVTRAELHWLQGQGWPGLTPELLAALDAREAEAQQGALARGKAAVAAALALS